jgi:autotransporter translocation and assembly factor TamB
VLAQTAGIAGEFDGVVQARVRGRVNGGKVVSGTVEVEGAVIRGVDLGRLGGSFEYADGTVHLRDIKVAGDTATGVLEATFTMAGEYGLRAHFQALDLSAIGPAVRLAGLRGQCCAQVEAKGRIGEGEASGRIVLGPGELQGRPFEQLSADFSVSPERVGLGNLSLKAGAGDYRGDLVVTDWRGDPSTAEVTGRIELEGAELAEWVPTRFAPLPGGSASGSADLSGTLADPEVIVDVVVSDPTLAGQPLEAGRIKARYEQQRLTIEEMYLDTDGGRISVEGDYGPDTGLDIGVKGEELVLGELSESFRSRFGLAMTGTLMLDATVTGPMSRPEVSFALSSGPLSMNEVAFDELVIAGGYRNGALRLDTGTLRRGDRKVSLSGQIGPEAAVDVALGMEAVDLKTALMIGDRAVWRLYRAGVRSKFFAPYAKIPRPLEGTLTGVLRVTETLDEPQAEASLTLQEIGFNGRRIERIEGEATAWLSAEKLGGYALDSAEVDVEATHDVARATLTGDIVPPDSTYLVLDVGNLDLRLLAPWLGTDVELGGMATINFDISGSLTSPVLRGDIFADDLRVGGLTLEAAAASPIHVEEGVLNVEEIRLRNGPMEGHGSAELPIDGITTLPEAELHLTEASLSLLPEMQPAVFDADVYLVGNRLILRDGGGPDSELAIPGIQGSLGSGAFEVGGEIVLRELSPARWDRNRFDVTAEFRQAQVVMGSFLDLQVSGVVALRNDPTTGRPRLTTPRDLLVSEATLGLPDETLGAPSGEMPFTPDVEARLLVGQNVVFRYGSDQRPTEIRITPGEIPQEGEPTGYLDIGGRLSADGLTLDGEARSSEGRLSFPNGVLTLRRATAWLDKKAGGPPIVTVAAEADGRVGEYYVTMNPVGQVYPSEPEPGLGPPPFALNVSSAPYLEEAFVLALLVGPVVAPTRGGQTDVSTLLADPTRGSNSGGQITGVRLPAFGDSLGRQELSLDVGLTGSVQLRLAQRLSERVILTYVSALTGQQESYDLKASYQFTPLVSVGWAVNELDQARWEIQSFIPF